MSQFPPGSSGDPSAGALSDSGHGPNPTAIVGNNFQAGIALGIHLICLTELLPLSKKSYVRTRLLPLWMVTAIFLSLVVVFDQIAALGSQDPTLVTTQPDQHSPTILVAFCVFKAIFYIGDAFIYFERVKAFFILDTKWKNFCCCFLLVKAILSSVLSFIVAAQMANAGDFLSYIGLLSGPAFSAMSVVDVLLPAMQTIIIDLSILKKIVDLRRKLKSKVSADLRRLIRIVLLVFTAFFYFCIQFIDMSGNAGVMAQLVPGGVAIFLSLETFINVDLYTLDISLLSSGNSSEVSFINKTSSLSTHKSTAVGQASGRVESKV